MILYPAIDLKDGQAVRLTKGLMESAKVYSNEPFHLAQSFEQMGATWLHVVDLNGAFAGQPANLEQITKIRQSTKLKMQLGGGIRDEETIKRYLDMGVDRLILGSIAAKNPEFVTQMAGKYPIAVGIDAIDGYVAVEGWAEVSSLQAVELAALYSQAGVEAIICTDVGRDGTLSGVNVDFTRSIAKASGIDIIASGGVQGIEDIQALQKNDDVAGVIIGKAFYEGRIDLREAFKVASK